MCNDLYQRFGDTEGGKAQMDYDDYNADDYYCEGEASSDVILSYVKARQLECDLLMDRLVAEVQPLSH